jgi:hypothetical protein
MGWDHLKIFSRTTELEEFILTWMLKLYNVDSSFYKSWSSGVGRGHSRENHIYMFVLKKIFSRTSRPISMKLGTNHPWVKRIKNCWKERPGSFPGKVNHRNANEGWDHLKIFFLKNHSARRAHIYRKAFWYIVDSSLFKSWSLGIGRGNNRVKNIHICFSRKNLFKKPLTQKTSNLLKGNLM